MQALILTIMITWTTLVRCMVKIRRVPTEMESENIWTPVHRHKKRKASGSPLNQNSYNEAVESTN